MDLIVAPDQGQIAFLRALVPMTEQQRAALPDPFNRVAFVLAGAADPVTVLDAWGLLIASLEACEGTRKAERKIRDLLIAREGIPKSTAQESAFIASMWAHKSSYNAAKWEEMNDPESQAFRPYRQFVAIVDGDTQEVCRALDGVIMEATDPRWEGRVPPLHAGCRSTILSLRRREVERMGGPTMNVPGGASSGWGRIPLKLAELQSLRASVMPYVWA
jgi:SPP1 gp7 family putative phage head morphogenesis protein